MVSRSPAADPDAEHLSALNRILDAVHAATALLPPQGPITKFAFLNPLQGLEHRHYDEVMREVGGMYGNQAYLDDSRYREKLKRGRITEIELREVLGEDLGVRGAELVSGLTPRIELRLATLLYPLHFGQRRELDWVLAETEALRFFRPEVSPETKRRLLEANRNWLLSDPTLEISAELGAAIDRFKAGQRHAYAPTSDGTATSGGATKSDEAERLYLGILWSMIRDGVETAVELASSGEVAPATGDEDRETPVDTASTTAREDREQDASRIERLTRYRLTTSDPDVDELMIRFTAAYLDQGYAATPLPAGEQGYWASFRLLYGRPALLAPRWRRSLPRELDRIREAKLSPLEVIHSWLEQLGISETEQREYIAGALLSLRGFAGMIWQTESRPDLFRKPSPPGTLIEFLAVRLLLLRTAKARKDAPQLENRAEVQNHPDRLRGARDAEQQAFLLFELAQVLEWTPQRLQGLRPPQWQALLQELDEFCDHQRRRIFHAAFERCLAKMTLRAFSLRAAAPPIRPASPWLQVVCCIDAREESLRRNLEELDPAIETFGIAGFFGVPMYYRGVGDANYSAQCPIVMKPQHWVIEEPVYSLEESDRSRARARRLIGNAQRRLRSQSRGSLGGAIVSTLLGPLATIPMLSRILLPRGTALMNRTARQFIAPPTITRLRLERAPEFAPAPFLAPRDRKAAEPMTGAERQTEPLTGDEGLGFTLAEMTQMSGKALRDMGLTQFAPLVILLGHGSGCLNNPHESAYHCGACAGNAGGPNARALAMMLNDARVRRQLAATGLAIPEETYFIGGQHNTATEEMMFFDLEMLPTPKVKSVRAAGRLLGEAAKRNAHERCRRFESAGLDLSLDEALLHVQNRSEDLAQTRPEYGNGTNAISFVGRRSRIRGLFLDRRSFLMSYDPTQDTTDSAILARILAAVVPVCEGINLLYTLSAIDPIGWGSGTKLPHNVTSLIGVMDGAASDLRTGLPWQGVDIHEPVRLLFVIETTTDAILKIMSENATIDRIFRNHWAHLAVLDPHSAELQRFSKDRFVPYRLDPDLASGEALPTAARSIDWYRSRRDHLPFALIKPDPARAAQHALYAHHGRAL